MPDGEFVGEVDTVGETDGAGLTVGLADGLGPGPVGASVGAALRHLGKLMG